LEFSGFGVFRFWSFQVLEFSGFGVFKFWSFQVLEFSGFEVFKFWSFQVLKLLPLAGFDASRIDKAAGLEKGSTAESEFGAPTPPNPRSMKIVTIRSVDPICVLFIQQSHLRHCILEYKPVSARHTPDR
jgi:hypothetical protein